MSVLHDRGLLVKGHELQLCITVPMFPGVCPVRCRVVGWVFQAKKYVNSSDNVKQTVYCGPTLEAVCWAWIHVKLMVCVCVLQNYIVCMGEYR